MQTLPLVMPGTEPLPSFEVVQADLNSLLQSVYEALDAGAASCRRYYDEFCNGDQPGSHLREMIVRDQARRFLFKHGHEVRVLRELPHMQLVAEPLISLLVHCNGYAVRVLKGRHGIPPGCGMSRKRKAFYNQAPIRFLNERGEPDASTTNLLLLWDFDSLFGISRVWLACPQRAGAHSQDVVLAWKEQIGAPVQTQSSVLRMTEQNEQAAADELEALLTETEPVQASGDEADLLFALLDEDASTGEPVELPGKA